MPPKFAVKICRATSLSMGGQKPDAYVKLKLGHQNKQKTKVVKGYDPIWNEWFDFDNWKKDEKLLVEVMHYNALNSNILLGKVKFAYPDDKSGHTKARVELELQSRGNTSFLEIQIVNIAVKQRQAGMQYNVTTDEGEKLVRSMMKGSEWQLVDEKHGKQRIKEIILYYVGQSDEYPIGAVIWLSASSSSNSAPTVDNVSSKHILAVHTLTDVYIGSPCTHADSVDADKDLCFTLKGEKSFNLVCGSDVVLDDWIRGLRFSITSKGKKCANVDVAGSAYSSATKGDATSWDHPPNEAVQQMLNGCEMVSYTNEKKPRKDNVFVFFSRGGGKYGSIYWSSGAKVEDPAKCIYLHQLTDIYVGKQQPIFQGSIASGVEDQCCFSIVSKRHGKRIQLHIEAETVEVMKTWMVGINHILTTIGRKVVLESESGEKKTTGTGRRFSRHFSVAVRAKSTHPGVLQMADGAYFTRYRLKKSKKDRSVKTHVFVFHSRLGGANEIGGSGSGALFWYEKTDKQRELEERKKDRRCIPVQSITDIYCGKQHGIFKTKVANEAKEDCVFSIKGIEVSKGNKENFLLHLEAANADVVKTWMQAIAHLLDVGGRSVEQVGQKDEETQPVEGQKQKRMSVAPPSNDPLDILGFNPTVAEPQTEDLNTFFPQSRPANPFDAPGEWDPFSEAPPPRNDEGEGKEGGKEGATTDLSSFFGNDSFTDPPPPTSEIPVLAPTQDSVWGTNDPFSSPPEKKDNNTIDPFSGSDPFSDPNNNTTDIFGSDAFSGGGQTTTTTNNNYSDPFGSPDAFSSGPPQFAPPPVSNNNISENNLVDLFGSTTQSSAPQNPPPSSSSSFPVPQEEGDGEIARFLQSIGLQSYIQKFAEEKIDMDALRYFTKQDLKELGIPTGPAIKIIRTLENWQG